MRYLVATSVEVGKGDPSEDLRGDGEEVVPLSAGALIVMSSVPAGVSRMMMSSGPCCTHQLWYSSIFRIRIRRW